MIDVQYYLGSVLGPDKSTSIDSIEFDFTEFLTSSLRFIPAFLRKLDIHPSCESVLSIPKGLTMTNKDQQPHSDTSRTP